MGENDGGNDADWTKTAAGYFQPNTNYTKEQTAALAQYNRTVDSLKSAASQYGANSRQARTAMGKTTEAMKNLLSTGWTDNENWSSRGSGSRHGSTRRGKDDGSGLMGGSGASGPMR